MVDAVAVAVGRRFGIGAATALLGDAAHQAAVDAAKVRAGEIEGERQARAEPVRYRSQGGTSALLPETSRLAEAAAAAGGSPRAQLVAARSSGQKAVAYKAHQGKREAERRRRRAARAAAG